MPWRCLSRPRSETIGTERPRRALACRSEGDVLENVHWSYGIRRDRLSEAATTPTPKLAFFTIAATLAYLGLAILMGRSPPPSSLTRGPIALRSLADYFAL